MSTTFIIEKLESIVCVKKRKAEANRLFRVFDDHIPNGSHNPSFGPDGPSDDDVRSHLRWGENFFDKIRLLCNNEFTPEINQRYSLFLRNAEYTRKMLSMNRHERRSLNTHEIFPFCFDFNDAIQNLFRGCNPEINLEEIIFQPDLIGQGGFANVYQAQDARGRKYALKLFHPFCFYVADQRREHNRLINIIAENISSQQDLWMQKPFVPISAISHDKVFFQQFAYIRDYFEGDNIDCVITAYPKKLDKTLMGRILLFYAEMLSDLHLQKKVFVDNSWTNVMINEKEMRVCDFDFVTPIDKLEEEGYPFHRCFASQEHLTDRKPTYSGDLESFALMVHQMIFREDFMPVGPLENHMNHEKARQNKRPYPDEYKKALPRKLREIIPNLITYPRDDSITAVDFLCAIKRDFRL